MLFDVIRDLELAPPTSSDGQITARMREVRSLPLAQRKDVYEHGRVEEQQEWYQSKAIWNKRYAGRWTRTDAHH